MAITFTRHGRRPREGNGNRIDVLDGQLAGADGDETTLASGGSTLCTEAQEGLWLFRPGADGRLRIGAANEDATKGEPLKLAEGPKLRWVASGQTVKWQE